MAALRTLCFSSPVVCVRAVPEAPQIKSCVATVDTVSEPFSGPQCLRSHLSTGTVALHQSVQAACLALESPCQPRHHLGQASPTQAWMPPLLRACQLPSPAGRVMPRAGQRPGPGEGGWIPSPVGRCLSQACSTFPAHLTFTQSGPQLYWSLDCSIYRPT